MLRYQCRKGVIIYVENSIYHNTPSIVNRGKIINYTKYFITDVFCVFKLALLMLLTGALMVGGLFLVVGMPYFVVSLFI